MEQLIEILESSFEDHLKKYSELKEKYEKMRDEYISKFSNLSLPKETLELMISEEIGFGWMSREINNFKSECDTAEKKLLELNERRRLVLY